MTRPSGAQPAQEKRVIAPFNQGQAVQPSTSQTPALKRRPARVAVELNEHDAESLRALQRCIGEASPDDLESVLSAFQFLKNAQKSIEASVSLNGKLGQSSPLSKPVQMFVKRFSRAVAEGKIMVNQLPLRQLEVICLGLTACIGLGHPNLFSLHGPASDDLAHALATIVDEAGKCVQCLGSKVLTAEAGRTLNVHNMVPRLLKAELMPTREAMRQISRHCLRAMLNWAEAPDLSLLVSPEEDPRFEQERRIKRWGKSGVQVDAFIERSWALLDLGSGADGIRNRKSIGVLVNWIYSDQAMSQLFHDQGSAPVVLSGLVHLMRALIRTGDMAPGADTETLLVRLMDAISIVMAQPGMERQIRPVMNFCVFLADVMAWRAQGWTPHGRDSLAAACAACMPTLGRLCASEHELDTSDAALVLGFLRESHDWCTRHATTSSTTTATTTTTTTTTATTTTTMTTMTTTTSATGREAEVAHAWGTLRGIDWRLLFQSVLAGLDADTLRANGRRETLPGLLEELGWLRQSGLVRPDMVDTLISWTLDGLADSRGPWQARAVSSVLKAVIGLLEWDLIEPAREQPLLLSMLGRPPQGKHWSLPQLRTRLGALKEAHPPLVPTKQQPALPPASVPRVDPWKGKVVGMSALVPQPVPAPRKDPTPQPSVKAIASPGAARPVSEAQVQDLQTVLEAARPALPEDRSEEEEEPAQQDTAHQAHEAGARRRGRGKRGQGGRGRGAGRSKAVHPVVSLPNTQKELDTARKATAVQKADPSPAPARAPLDQGLLDSLKERGLIVQSFVEVKGLKKLSNPGQAASIISNLAKQGHAPAQLQLGLMYRQGTEVSRNPELAFKWLELAAGQGEVSAWFHLGECYFKGWGVPSDDAKALHWFGKAAQDNHVDAQYHLGSCYEFGFGSDVNIDEALRWYQRASEKGSSAAQCAIASLYLENKVPLGEPAQAYAWAKKAADQGNPQGKYHVAECLLDGLGVTADKNAAIALMREAADGQSPLAQYWLAKHVLKSEEKLWPQAEGLLKLASAAGHVEALCLLGLLYCTGTGVKKNVTKGERLIRQAAEQGSEDAQAHLAKKSGQ